LSRKLSYTAEAFAARVRMSKEAALFIVVEGRDLDTPFYEGIAKSSERVRERGYQIWLIEQITRQVPDGSGSVLDVTAGGKIAQIQLFEFYKDTDSLSATNSAGKRAILFCIDKDLDDVAKILRRSPHLAYTPMADVEASVYAFSNQAAGLARATSLSEEDAAAFLAQHPDWMGSLAKLWRRWIELCALAIAHSAYCHVGTTKPSKVNTETYGVLDSAEEAMALAVIRQKSQIPLQRHASMERRVLNRVDRMFVADKGRRLVGKHWLIPYLIYLLKDYFGSAPIGISNLKHKAPVAFLDALDFKGSWASPYRRKFEALV